MIGSNLLQRTDYLLQRINFFKTFKTRIPSREECAANSVMRDYAVSIFTDGSKTETGTGCGVISDDLYIWMSIRLHNT